MGKSSIMVPGPSENRRTFLRISTVGIASALAGCSFDSAGDPTTADGQSSDTPAPTEQEPPTAAPDTTGQEQNTATQEPTDRQPTTEPQETTDRQQNTETETETETETAPDYSLQASTLQYDLTGGSISVYGLHDKAFVDENHSANPELVLLEDGEQTDLAKLTNVRFRDESSNDVAMTDQGHIPVYAVADGERITITGQVNGQDVIERITVEKTLPEEYRLDATLFEDGEAIFSTDYDSPYIFDDVEADLDTFLDNRVEAMREWIPEGWANTNTDLANDLEESWREDRHKIDTEEERKRALLSAVRNVATSNVGTPDDLNAPRLGGAMELVMRDMDSVDYDDMYVGHVANYSEERNDLWRTLVAYVEGDWYHVGTVYAEVFHIDTLVDDPETMRIAKPINGDYTSSLVEENEPGELTGFSPITNLGVNSPDEAWIDDEFNLWRLEKIRDNTSLEEFLLPEILMSADEQTGIEHGKVGVKSGEEIQIDKRDAADLIIDQRTGHNDEFSSLV